MSASSFGVASKRNVKLLLNWVALMHDKYSLVPRDSTCSPERASNGSFRVSSNIVRNPLQSDGDFKTQQELEFDRWRTAIEIVQRMREAGISCELSNDLKKGQ